MNELDDSKSSFNLIRHLFGATCQEECSVVVKDQLKNLF